MPMIEWNPFEPDETPPERTGIRKKIEQVFHWLMLTALFGIVFTVSGAFLVVRLGRVIYHSQDNPHAVEIGTFIAGGALGSLLLARICFGKWRK